MKFSIDFNRHSDDKAIESLGAELVEYDEHYQYEVEIKDLEALRDLEKLIESKLGIKWSMIVGFDSNTIYLDDDV